MHFQKLGIGVDVHRQIEDDGGTRFEPEAKGPHRYLIASEQQVIRVREVLVQLSSQPPLAKQGE